MTHTLYGSSSEIYFQTRGTDKVLVTKIVGFVFDPAGQLVSVETARQMYRDAIKEGYSTTEPSDC
jgi:hypothetical protein